MKQETQDLQKLMRLAGWNQAQTAKELGIAQGNVSRLVHEKSAMHGSTKILIEKLLKECEQVVAGDVARRAALS